MDKMTLEPHYADDCVFCKILTGDIPSYTVYRSTTSLRPFWTFRKEHRDTPWLSLRPTLKTSSPTMLI